jgi:NitT/TauT family transport system substrate-binding protein
LKSIRILISLSLFLCWLLVFAWRDSAPLPPLKIGANQWIGYGTLYLACNDQPGGSRQPALKLIEMPSATAVARALRNEMLDAAALTLDEALTLRQFVPDLRIILVLDHSVGADVLLAKPEIQSLAALKNKRIGVETNAVGAIWLDGVLRRGKLEPGDIKLVPVAVNRHEQYYRNNQVDAVVTFEPYKSRLIAQGAHSLFDSSALPGRIMDVLVTRDAVIQQREAELKALLAAYFQAQARFSQHRADAMEIIASYLGVRRNEAEMQAKGITVPDLMENRELLLGLPGLKAKVDELATLMRERQLLLKPIDTDNFLTGRLLPAV